MEMVVILLRLVALFSFAAFMLAGSLKRPAKSRSNSAPGAGTLMPVTANLAAFAVFVVTILWTSQTPAEPLALLLAIAGAAVAIVGGIFVLRARAALGSAWSLEARADKSTGLVTTGPYRLVRHPIYLGFTVLTIGQAIAFASAPAILVVLLAIVPTLVWRAMVEEVELAKTFGEDFEVYRSRTGLLLPGIF